MGSRRSRGAEEPRIRLTYQKPHSNWPTIPQIYVKGEFIGGTDILYNMHQSGELEDLLVKEGIVPKDE